MRRDIFIEAEGGKERGGEDVGLHIELVEFEELKGHQGSGRGSGHLGRALRRELCQEHV